MKSLNLMVKKANPIARNAMRNRGLTMNRELLEEIGFIYKAAFQEANNVLEFAEEKAAYQSVEQDVMETTTELFREYCRRISPQRKGVENQHDKGNNSENPASEAQKTLIKTMVMEMGIAGDKKYAEARDIFGLKKLPDYEELHLIKMGDAHLIIDMLRQEKEKIKKKKLEKLNKG